MSNETVNFRRTDRELQARLEDKRKIFQQVIDEFDWRMDQRLDKLRASMNEFWDNEDRGIALQSKEYMEEEIKELSINEKFKKKQRSLKQKLKKPKKPRHKKSFSCISKGLQKLIKSVTGKDREIIEKTNRKMDTQSNSGRFSKISESQNDPEFSEVLLKWPPEGASLKPIPMNSGTQ